MQQVKVEDLRPHSSSNIDEEMHSFYIVCVVSNCQREKRSRELLSEWVNNCKVKACERFSRCASGIAYTLQ